MATQSDKTTSFISITFEGNYFNTKEQITRRNARQFIDASDVYKIKSGLGAGKIEGFFSRQTTKKDDVIYNSALYTTSSTVIDKSGAERVYLSPKIDYYASSSVDVYRNGVEITRENQWTAGLSKITAGTPGHLFEKNYFGISDTSIIDPDRYYEIEVFDPIHFVEVGGDPSLFVYPIVTSDSNQLENYNFNGIIEPFPIRSVISNFSIHFPFEPHSFRGNWMSGNENLGRYSDEVDSVYEWDRGPLNINEAWFLDASKTKATTNIDSTLSIDYEYVNMDQNHIKPFKDEILPRDVRRSDTYDNKLWNVLLASFTGSLASTYIEQEKATGCTGFMYNGSVPGTDSIAYGGLLY